MIALLTIGAFMLGLLVGCLASYKTINKCKAVANYYYRQYTQILKVALYYERLLGQRPPSGYDQLTRRNNLN